MQFSKHNNNKNVHEWLTKDQLTFKVYFNIWFGFVHWVLNINIKKTAIKLSCVVTTWKYKNKNKNPKQQQQQINKIFTIVYGLEMSSCSSTRGAPLSHSFSLCTIAISHENLCNKMLINNTMLNNKKKTKNSKRK